MDNDRNHDGLDHGREPEREPVREDPAAAAADLWVVTTWRSSRARTAAPTRPRATSRCRSRPRPGTNAAFTTVVNRHAAQRFLAPALLFPADARARRAPAPQERLRLHGPGRPHLLGLLPAARARPSLPGSLAGGGRRPGRYDWDFGDGGHSAARDPEHVYAGPRHLRRHPDRHRRQRPRVRADTQLPGLRHDGARLHVHAHRARGGPERHVHGHLARPVRDRLPRVGLGRRNREHGQLQPGRARLRGQRDVLRDPARRQQPRPERGDDEDGDRRDVAPTVDAGPNQDAGVGPELGDQPSVSDAGTVDRNSLVCTWDFGDGQTAPGQSLLLEHGAGHHAYASPAPTPPP